MRAFKVVITLVGLFIVATGVLEVALGPRALPGAETATPSADSNYRFFAVSWLALGVLLLAKRTDELVIRFVSATVFVGGLARFVSLAQAGQPQPMIYALLAVELVAPPLLVLWHRRLTRPAVGEALSSTS